MDAKQPHISRVLSEYKQGKTRGFDILVTQLSDPDVSRDFLVVTLKQLRDCISELNKEFEVLVGAILKVDWLSHDATVAKEYQSFLLNLVSATTFFLRATLRMILLQFTPVEDKSSLGEVTVEIQSRNTARFSKLHMLLQALLHIVPMAPKVLQPLLLDCFPFIHRSTYQQQCYTHNLLQLSCYLPAQRGAVLEVIVERMTKLDVRASRQDVQDAEVEAESDADIFLMDGEAGVTNRQSMAHKDADRLDVLMDVMFKYIKSVCYKDGSLDWEASKKLYRELLLVFDRIILRTHACCHVQFLLFYVCSFKEPLVEGFLDFLLKKVQNPNTEIVFRQVAVAYMASLLARAKYIPVSTVRECLDLLVAWIHSYISNAIHTTSSDLTRHGPFFSVCQTVFYIFVFRHKQLLNMRKGVKYCQGLNLQSIVTSRLNPLRVCLPIIAKTFSSITRIHQLAFCDTILERNRRSMLPTAAEGAPLEDHLNPLDSFFPFDPYLLIRSRGFIVDHYQEYEGSPVEEDAMEQEGEEDVYGDELVQSVPDANHIAEQMLGTTPSSLKSPPTDFLMYGTSPGFQHTFT